jgi:ribosome-interacting GTPase 1
MAEVGAAGIDRPALLATTKMDDATPDALDHLAAEFPGREVIPVSIIDDDSLEALKERVWALTGLVRVYLSHAGEIAPKPIALPTGSTVLDVAAAVHSDLATSFRRARVWGGSVRFDGQHVGRDHVVTEGDIVEIQT